MEKIIQRQYVQDYSTLVELCKALEKSNMLAIDTEFVRTRTLYPKLGLLQVSDGEVIALIDPVTIDDLSPFWALMTNADICKVLHACSEDLEVFLTAANCKPVNLIDSQIMMAFLGHGLSLGYAAMVQHFTGVELDKSESRTDWIKRPLTERQKTYAEADVEYLHQIYPKIHQLVVDAGWLEAAQQETQLMIDRKFSPIDENLMYLNIKMNWKLNAKQLNALKYLAAWRYQQAQKRDMPLGFIAKDHTLIGVAQRNPISVGAMLSIEGVELLDIKHKGKAMLQVLNQANKVPESEYPQPIIRLDEYPAYKQIFKQVKTFVATAAKNADLLPENLASKKQINQFLSYHFKINNADKDKGVIDILYGWRLDLFGEKLQAYANNGFK
ncbi:ribonuclease D [Pseudocolwellia agarivorans]|uniref:ribonuclease D n=1 Tax=Pseudocolwellia agarivorans TaxID=1911682 RepID=UPI001FE5646B|nr:ribonuclease D [Pseudocolwellia agarivorans]